MTKSPRRAVSILLVVAIAGFGGFGLGLNLALQAHASPPATPSARVSAPLLGGRAVPAPSAIAILKGAPTKANLPIYRAPALRGPLPDLDPGLAKRGPRPTAAQLATYQLGNPFVIVNRFAGPDDWQLSRPNPGAVQGYGGSMSVTPGQSLDLHLAGADRSARLDVFRMGLADATHVLTVPRVDVPRVVRPPADPLTGLLEEAWPVAYKIGIPTDWASGVYLVKLTGSSGGQSYVLFVVRPSAPAKFVVVLPTMTYQAYNDYGGVDLYGWRRGPHPRAYVVSFDRPFAREFGAGLFFRLDFPLVVWLEDHGYRPSYITDLDLARDPSVISGASAVVFSGHSEYWTGGMRESADTALASGQSLLFFGANQAFWQVRLEPDGQGLPDRRMVCYKSAKLDPIAATDPGATTTRFQDAPVDRPPADLMGEAYGGIVSVPQTMTIAPGIDTFAPGIGLRAGQALPGLIQAADEVDDAGVNPKGLILADANVPIRESPLPTLAASSLWIGPGGGRVFDAGTFDYSWGLDPRYAAALPDFPTAGFSELTARILAWAGVEPAI